MERDAIHEANFQASGTDMLASLRQRQGLCPDCGAAKDKVNGGYACGSYFDATDASWPWISCKGGDDARV